MSLPNPGLSFSPFAILTAEEMNDIVENIEALSDGSGLADGSVTVNKISNNAITLAYSEVTSNQGGITSETNISGLSVTFNAPNNGRRIEVIVDCHIFSTVAGDTYRLSLKESTTTLQTAEGRLQGANQQQHECIHYSVVPTPGSHTYNVTLTRATGTGTLSTFQASIRPAFILVKAI
jgi:hypothetical protein